MVMVYCSERIQNKVSQENRAGCRGFPIVKLPVSLSLELWTVLLLPLCDNTRYCQPGQFTCIVLSSHSSVPQGLHRKSYCQTIWSGPGPPGKHTFQAGHSRALRFISGILNNDHISPWARLIHSPRFSTGIHTVQIPFFSFSLLLIQHSRVDLPVVLLLWCS